MSRYRRFSSLIIVKVAGTAGYSRSHAPALVVIHKSRQTENAVIPAGMQESSAMDGNSPLCQCLIQDTHQPADSPPCDWIPAVHAGMTGFNHLCITTRAGAWEPANQRYAFPDVSDPARNIRYNRLNLNTETSQTCCNGYSNPPPWPLC